MYTFQSCNIKSNDIQLQFLNILLASNIHKLLLMYSCYHFHDFENTIFYICQENIELPYDIVLAFYLLSEDIDSSQQFSSHINAYCSICQDIGIEASEKILKQELKIYKYSSTINEPKHSLTFSRWPFVYILNHREDIEVTSFTLV